MYFYEYMIKLISFTILSLPVSIFLFSWIVVFWIDHLYLFIVSTVSQYATVLYPLGDSHLPMHPLFQHTLTYECTHVYLIQYSCNVWRIIAGTQLFWLTHFPLSWRNKVHTSVLDFMTWLASICHCDLRMAQYSGA